MYEVSLATVKQWYSLKEHNDVLLKHPLGIRRKEKIVIYSPSKLLLQNKLIKKWK